MTAASTIGFTFPRALLSDAAAYLIGEFVYVGTIIGAGDPEEEEARAARIGRDLVKQASRRRKETKGHISARLTRADADWIARNVRPTLRGNGRAAITLVRIVKGALKRKRGPRRLSATALEARATGKRHTDERHRWRCRARLRRVREFARNFASRGRFLFAT